MRWAGKCGGLSIELRDPKLFGKPADAPKEYGLLSFNAPNCFPDPLAGFAFDGVPDLLFEIGLCVVVFMSRNHNSGRYQLEFPMRPLSTST